MAGKKKKYKTREDKAGCHALDRRCPLLLSPAQGQIQPSELAAWILEDGLPVRFQLQLHKLLWGNIQGK